MNKPFADCGFNPHNGDDFVFIVTELFTDGQNIYETFKRLGNP